MLLQSEILRIAEKESVLPDTIDKNCVLGHFLAAMVDTFKQKAAFKHIAFNNYSDFFNNEQISKMKQAWNNSLQAHRREDDFPDVNRVINEIETFFRKMNWH